MLDENFYSVIYFSGAGWAVANPPTNQLPVHLWDAEQMGKLLFKGPVLWDDEENHEASKNLEWRWSDNTRTCSFYLIMSHHYWCFIVPSCVVPFSWNQWSMSQLSSDPYHCSSHPAVCHQRNWAQTVRLFSMSLRWDLQSYCHIW